MTDEKEVKVTFAPGAFDHFEGTQEELDKFVAELQEMFAGKSLDEIAEMSRPLTEDEFDELPDDVKEQLHHTLYGEDGEDVPESHKRRLQ